MSRPRVAARLAGAALAFGLVAIGVAPPVQAQSPDSLLTVRKLDGTDKDAVELTFLWTGDAEDLQNLTIREDGQAVKVEPIVDLRATDTHMGTVVVMDLSGSMLDDSALTLAKEGVEGMLADQPEGDQMALVSFSDTVVTESPFTSDPNQIESALDGLAAPRDGKSALYDALHKASTLFASRPNLQPNIVLVTDGADDASKGDLVKARAAVAGSGAALFALDLSHKAETDVPALQSIIDRTGGIVTSGSSAAEVEKAFTELNTTLRSQFVATYASTKAQGSVDVTVAVGSAQRTASYVVGSAVQGAATEHVASVDKAFGPKILRGTVGVMLALVLVGLGAGLGAFALGALATKNENSLQAMLRPYDEDGGVAPEEGDNALAQTALMQRAVEMTEDFAQRQGFLEKVEKKLERADLPLRAAEALFFYFAAVFVLALLGLVALGFLAGFVLMIAAALVPPAALSFLANRRAKQFMAQLPDTLGLLSGSLRAGYSLMQGVESVSQEVEEPMGKELRRVITEARLGREIEEAMDTVAERMDSPDFAWAVMAIRIQREVGGNLSELLNTVADTMVQRDRLRRDVAALTAEGKISAIILGLLPIGLGAFMALSNPVYMAPLGNTGMGNVLLGLSLVSIIIGFVWMKKTINIEI